MKAAKLCHAPRAWREIRHIGGQPRGKLVRVAAYAAGHAQRAAELINGRALQLIQVSVSTRGL